LGSIADRLDTSRYPLMLILMIAISAFIGIVAGVRASFQFRSMFYALTLTNLLIAAYLLLLKDITFGIIVYLYALTFLNFYWRIVIPGHWPDLDLPRLVFVFIWVLFLLELSMGSRRLLPRTKTEVMMLLMVIAIIISMLTNGSVRIRKLLNGFAVPFAMFVVAKHVFASRRNVDRLLYWFAVPLSVYFPVNHMFEHYRIDQLVFPRYILNPEVAGRIVEHGERTTGTFLQASATGLAMVACFVLSLHALSRVRGILARLMMFFLTAITPVAVFFSYTRSVYLGFFSAMVIILVFSRRLKMYALIIILAIGLGVMGNWANVTTEDRAAGGLATKTTVVSRLAHVSASLRMFADHPFFGVGFLNFQEAAKPYVGGVRTTILGYRESWVGKGVNLHNHFLNVLTEIGLMGFVPLVLIFYFLFRILFKARLMHSEVFDRDFVVCTWAIFAQYLSASNFMDPTFYEFMNVLPFLLAGIIAGAYQRQMLQRSGATVLLKGA
jgi:O-antigen ligase